MPSLPQKLESLNKKAFGRPPKRELTPVGDPIPAAVINAGPVVPLGVSVDAHPTLADWHAALEARAATITVGPPAVIDVRGDGRIALVRSDVIPTWATHYRRQLVGRTGEWLPIPKQWMVRS